MDYSYTINKVLPKAEFMSVTYSAEGFPDYRRNFNPVEFTQEHLTQLVENFAPYVVEFWERQAGHPEEFIFEGGSSSAEAPVIDEVDFSHAPVIEPRPEIDPFTQYATVNEIEHPMQETVGWTIHERTAEEIAEYLANWRATVSATMRQARLALAQQGLLQAVEDAIAGIADNEQIKIEWEYANTVQRSSAWVISLSSALGLSEEQLDDLFKIAGTL